MNGDQKKSGLQRFLNRFIYAWRGIIYFYKMESNAVIHTIASILAIVLGIYFEIGRNSWMAIIMVIALVFSTELFNTAIEELSDHVSPDWNKRIKIVKDLSASAVFIAAICSIVIGALVFIPHVFK